jgi:hypothetical protein
LKKIASIEKYAWNKLYLTVPPMKDVTHIRGISKEE